MRSNCADQDVLVAGGGCEGPEGDRPGCVCPPGRLRTHGPHPQARPLRSALWGLSLHGHLRWGFQHWWALLPQSALLLFQKR
jgi:hypothetical protein